MKNLTIEMISVLFFSSSFRSANRRTADVRSVGYSELFSLSREDVRAAMKDYPEAEEILITLGNKRLMEVRCVNKKHTKNVAERESIASNVRNKIVNSNRTERRMSERLADKLRSDVKGIKNVLKKSRWFVVIAIDYDSCPTYAKIFYFLYLLMVLGQRVAVVMNQLKCSHCI